MLYRHRPIPHSGKRTAQLVSNRQTPEAGWLQTNKELFWRARPAGLKNRTDVVHPLDRAGTFSGRDMTGLHGADRCPHG